jgi:hypothetical protein
MKNGPRIFGVVFFGTCLLIPWIIVSIVLGEDMFEWYQRRTPSIAQSKGIES